MHKKMGRVFSGSLAAVCVLTSVNFTGMDRVQAAGQPSADVPWTTTRYELFHTQIGVGNRLDGGRRCVKKYLWSFLRTAPAGQVRL